MFIPTESELRFQASLEDSYHKLNASRIITAHNICLWLKRSQKAYQRDVLNDAVRLPGFKDYGISNTTVGLIDGIPHVQFCVRWYYNDAPEVLQGLGRFFKLIPHIQARPAIGEHELTLTFRFNLEQWPALVMSEIWKGFYEGTPEPEHDDDRAVDRKKEDRARAKFLMKYFHPEASPDSMTLATELGVLDYRHKSFPKLFDSLLRSAQIPSVPPPDEITF